jgi:hypothetical protein
MGGGNIRDVNVPFKLIHRPVWDDVSGAIPSRPVAPSMLIAVGAATRGWRVAQVAITHLPRRHGPSSVNLKALFRLSWGALTELMRFRKRVARLPRREPTRSKDSVGAAS